MKKALYAGTFDPFTLGHLDIVDQAMQTFDEVHIAIAKNPDKGDRLFDPIESATLIKATIQERYPCEPFEHLNVTIGAFWHRKTTRDGFAYPMTTDDYATEIGATHLVRGLRQISDFQSEFAQRGAIEHIDEGDPPLIMTYFICQERYLHVSSSMARGCAKHGKRLDWLVGPTVEKALRAKFADSLANRDLI